MMICAICNHSTVRRRLDRYIQEGRRGDCAALYLDVPPQIFSANIRGTTHPNEMSLITMNAVWVAQYMGIQMRNLGVLDPLGQSTSSVAYLLNPATTPLCDTLMSSSLPHVETLRGPYLRSAYGAIQVLNEWVPWGLVDGGGHRSPNSKLSRIEG